MKWPIISRFGFSTLRFCTISVVLISLPLIRLLLIWQDFLVIFASILFLWRDKHMCLVAFTKIKLLLHPEFSELPKCLYNFLVIVLKFRANLEIPFMLRLSPIPSKCLLAMFLLLIISILVRQAIHIIDGLWIPLFHYRYVVLVPKLLLSIFVTFRI